MSERKRIGIPFLYDSGWAGGLYYITNIIRSLATLPDAERPELFVFYRNAEIQNELEKLDYPYLHKLPIKKPFSFFGRLRAKFEKIFFGKIISTPQYDSQIVNFVFPCDNYSSIVDYSLKNVPKAYWIADFQHKYLPGFFDSAEIDRRDRVFEEIASKSGVLVLSSENAKSDFIKFYPRYQVNIAVIPFATVLPDFENIPINSLLGKFGIGARYFMAPNQFWAHKNHMVILKAALLLKHSTHDFRVVFTGREEDVRNAGYVKELKDYVQANGLADTVLFLGFIDRKEQLQLMKHSMAVIQPSMFEGWSTVVEDAKAISQSLIVSNLEVHREQCGNSAFYFSPSDEVQLCKHMKSILDGQRTLATGIDYNINVVDFARKILSIGSK